MRSESEPPAGEQPASRRAFLRGGFASLTGVGLIGVFASGRCHYHCGDDDDNDFDDDDCDDDDDFYVSSSPSTLRGPPSLRIEQFEIESARAADMPPIAHLREVRGVSLETWRGAGPFGAAELADFTGRLLAANEGLIGVVPGAGRAVYLDTSFGSDRITVRWVQVRADATGAERVVPGTRIDFTFDLIGALIEVENRTRQ